MHEKKPAKSGKNTYKNVCYVGLHPPYKRKCCQFSANLLPEVLPQQGFRKAMTNHPRICFCSIVLEFLSKGKTSLILAMHLASKLQNVVDCNSHSDSSRALTMMANVGSDTDENDVELDIAPKLRRRQQQWS